MTKKASLFDLYFEYVKDTEPPLIYHRWSLIAGVGAFIGRQYWFPFGEMRIFPNQYVMLIGNPGTRKSTAIKMMKRILSKAGYDKFSAERTTKEKFLLDLEGTTDEELHGYAKRSKGASTPRDVLANLDLLESTEIHDGIPREVFITADEFNEFAGTGNLDFLSTLGALWDWDDESNTYRQRFKNSKSISIFQPTISLLGGNTHTGFQNAFPTDSIGQGFLSRLLLVHSEPSGRKITFPSKPDERIAVALGERFNEIRKSVSGEAQVGVSARGALDTIYRTWKDLDDYRLRSYSTRRFTHLIKLCLVCSAMRGSNKIDMEDVLLANTILTYTENSMSKALGEFGKNRNSEASHAVMTSLYETTRPMNFDDLWRVVDRYLEKREALKDILLNLQTAGKITLVDKKGFLPVQRPVDSRALYVDLKLLKEMQ